MKINWIIVIVALLVMGVFMVAVLGILVAIAVPGFLRAREISRRNACQENQAKIDGAIMQYILEFRLSGVGPDGGEGFLDYLSIPNQDQMNQLTWLSEDTVAPGKAALFGENAYVRYVSICPSGGFYHIQDPESPTAVSDYAVYCTLRHRADSAPAFFHVFPGEDALTVRP